VIIKEPTPPAGDWDDRCWFHRCSLLENKESFNKSFTSPEKNDSYLKSKIELFLEEKLNKDLEELEFRIKEISKDFIVIDIIKPVYHSKGIPIKEFLQFLGGGPDEE